MFACCVCALLSFSAQGFPVKPPKNLKPILLTEPCIRGKYWPLHTCFVHAIYGKWTRGQVLSDAHLSDGKPNGCSCKHWYLHRLQHELSPLWKNWEEVYLLIGVFVSYGMPFILHTRICCIFGQLLCLPVPQQKIEEGGHNARQVIPYRFPQN